jgi:hypothetical protein
MCMCFWDCFYSESYLAKVEALQRYMLVTIQLSTSGFLANDSKWVRYMWDLLLYYVRFDILFTCSRYHSCGFVSIQTEHTQD